MNNLNFGTEQFGDFSKNVVDAAAKFAKVGFESTERFFALNLEAAKVGFDETARNTKAAARATDDWVHENPWGSIGIAAGVGFLVGLLVSRR